MYEDYCEFVLVYYKYENMAIKRAESFITDKHEYVEIINIDEEGFHFVIKDRYEDVVENGCISPEELYMTDEEWKAHYHGIQAKKQKEQEEIDRDFMERTKKVRYEEYMKLKKEFEEFENN